MSTPAKPAVGTIGWVDLTVENAEAVRDFYTALFGWKAAPLSMGDYDDYMISPPEGDPIAGVCHARGVNAGVPPVWMIYVTVDDLQASLERCVELGGRVLFMHENGMIAVIRDPADAVLALYQPPPDS